jgi:prepilin-type N-terminal cleavage/methylation domain-containing protein
MRSHSRQPAACDGMTPTGNAVKHFCSGIRKNSDVGDYPSELLRVQLPPGPRFERRRGFTLVELLVVISIILILASMTIYAINLSVTTERVRSGARQIQSLIEGARDRAIYAGEARGIRILVDETITEDHDGDPATPEIATTSTTIVYIGSPGAYESEPDSSDINFNGDREEPVPTIPGALGGPYVNVMHPDDSEYVNQLGMTQAQGRLAAKALIGVGTRFSQLAEQKLIRAGTRVRLGRDSLGEAQNSTELLTIHPASFPIRTESQWFGGGGELNFGGPADVNRNTNDDEVIFLTTTSQTIEQHGLGVPFPPAAGPPPRLTLDGNWHFSIETEADVLPGEEPSVLPRNCCIDLETSHLPSNWVTVNPTTGVKQFSNRMDLLFAPGGAIVGREGAAGVIHLHVSHTQDALDNVPPGSQTLDGTPTGPPRQGEEFGVTIFTKSGRVIVHPIDWSGYPVPATEFRNLGFTDSADFDGNADTLGYWQPSTSYSAGNIVAPRLYDGNVYLCIDSSGQTGSGYAGGEPPWNRQAGGLTRDGGVTWRTVRHNVWRMGLEGELAR